MPQSPNATPSPEAILQTGLAFWPAKTLLSAIELGLLSGEEFDREVRPENMVGPLKLQR